MGAALVRTARPRQWVKNVLVFAAPGAAGVLFHAGTAARAMAAFALFSMAASGTYFLNDAVDHVADRLNPTKRHRPVAAGDVPVGLAKAVGACLLTLSLPLALAVDARLALALPAYCLWAFEKAQSSGHAATWFELSIVPFVIAILRYALLIDGGQGGAPEDVVLADRSLQVIGAVWVLLFALGVYAG